MAVVGAFSFDTTSRRPMSTEEFAGEARV